MFCDSKAAESELRTSSVGGFTRLPWSHATTNGHTYTNCRKISQQII